MRNAPDVPEHNADPSSLPGLLRLASIQLPVRAVKGASLSALAARLAPFGMCAKEMWHCSTPAAGGNLPLGLDGLFRRIPDYSTGKSEPAFLELRSLPQTGAGSKRESRPSRLVVMHADGTAPTEYVLQLAKGTTKRELLQRATQLCGLGAGQQLVITQVDPVPALTSDTLAVSKMRGWVAGVVVGPISSAAYSAGYGYNSVISYGDSEAMLDEKLPSGTRLAGSFPTFVATVLPKGQFVAVHLRKLGSKTQAFKRAREVRFYGPSVQIRTKTTWGVLAILPAPAAGLRGGAEAVKQLQASLQTFLQPFLKPEAEYPQPQLVHTQSVGTWEETLMQLYGRRPDAELDYGTVKEAPAALVQVVCYVGADSYVQPAAPSVTTRVIGRGLL